MGKQSFLKKFLFNKNTVTILGVAAIIAILYYGYNYRINEKVKLVKVPYAKQNIDPRTQITNEMLGELSLPSSMLIGGTILTNSNEIVNKYSNYNTMIPEGSVFYKSAVVEKSSLPDANWINVPDCDTVISLPISKDLAMGNSIFPGYYINIYYKGTDSDGKMLYTDFIKNIQVLAVKDSRGNNVFDKSADLEDTAYLLFAVDEYTHLLITRAQKLGGQFDIIQVAGSYDAEHMDIEINTYMEQKVNENSAILAGQPTSIEEANKMCEARKNK